MDDARRVKYEKLLAETKEDLQSIDEQIEFELAQIKERITGLQNDRKAQMTIYGGYCQLLGIENDLETDEEE